MRSPQPATVVIACPHCGTRYQVPPETLGATGRTVSCAHCGKAWLATAPAPEPEDDVLFSPGEEEALDREFAAVEKRSEIAAVPSSLRKLMPQEQPPPPEVVKSIAEIKAAIAPRPPEPAPKPKVAEAPKAKPDKPQRGLPLARLYPLVRTGAVLLLVGTIVGGLVFRTEIVRALPQMAGVYAAIGMPVNVVGLEFSDVSTLTTRRGEETALTVTAKIRAVGGRRTAIPPVVVTLLDEDGGSLYEWSVSPPAPDVAPGEVVDLAAELAAPPEGARELRLSFADGRIGRASIAPPPVAPVAAAVPEPAHDEPVANE
ncbi:MAG: zinc-ribbon domain-containing protein [Devosia sp.]